MIGCHLFQSLVNSASVGDRRVSSSVDDRAVGDCGNINTNSDGGDDDIKDNSNDDLFEPVSSGNLVVFSLSIYVSVCP